MLKMHSQTSTDNHTHTQTLLTHSLNYPTQSVHTKQVLTFPRNALLPSLFEYSAHHPLTTHTLMSFFTVLQLLVPSAEEVHDEEHRFLKHN